MTVFGGLQAVLFCGLAIQLAAAKEDQPRSKGALPAAKERADVFEPCGNYDIQKLADHFRVTVEARRLPTGHTEVVITTDSSAGDKDARKRFPKDQLRLMVLDGKGGTTLETSIQWTKNERLDKESRATLLVAPDIAKRLSLSTAGHDILFVSPFHAISISFRSLAE